MLRAPVAGGRGPAGSGSQVDAQLAPSGDRIQGRRPCEGDRRQPTHRRLRRQPTGGGHGRQAVCGEFVGGDVVAHRAGGRGLGDELGHHAPQAVAGGGDLLVAMVHRRQLGVVPPAPGLHVVQAVRPDALWLAQAAGGHRARSP